MPFQNNNNDFKNLSALKPTSPHTHKFFLMMCDCNWMEKDARDYNWMKKEMTSHYTPSTLYKTVVHNNVEHTRTECLKNVA
jgi:hypothetical protein